MQDGRGHAERRQAAGVETGSAGHLWPGLAGALGRHGGQLRGRRRGTGPQCTAAACALGTEWVRTAAQSPAPTLLLSAPHDQLDIGENSAIKRTSETRTVRAPETEHRPKGSQGKGTRERKVTMHQGNTAAASSPGSGRPGPARRVCPVDTALWSAPAAARFRGSWEHGPS